MHNLARLSFMIKNILITGMPRSGKSTLLKEVVLKLQNKVGFITNEVRKDGARTGFEIELHSNKKVMLADINFVSQYKVSRYFVEINNLDSVLPEVLKFDDSDILYLDEIGQMQLFSDKFKEVAVKFLDSKNLCIATISKIYNDDFIESIKQRKDVVLLEITEKNREKQKKLIEDLINRYGFIKFNI